VVMLNSSLRTFCGRNHDLVPFTHILGATCSISKTLIHIFLRGIIITMIRIGTYILVIERGTYIGLHTDEG
jgi:hypothetical protein